jgi:hypothetical protein
LVDVGLRGNEESQIVNGYAIFSGLKFQSTSYNHEGLPFHIVVTIYQGSMKTNSRLPLDAPLVLLSKISPPVYVTSRKLTKDTPGDLVTPTNGELMSSIPKVRHDISRDLDLPL